MSLIVWLWNVRQWVVSLTLLVAAAGGIEWVYLRGKDAGRGEIQAKWDADKLQQTVSLAQWQARTEAGIVRATATLSQRLAMRDQATVTAMKGIRDEIARNATYRDCHLTTGGVRLYNAAGVSATDAGRDSR